MKENFEPLSFEENRKILAWLTSKHSTGLLEVFQETDVIKYCLCGNFTEIQQFKQDAKVLGYVVIFESNSPFAYSDVITKEYNITKTTEITLENHGDVYEDAVSPRVTLVQGDSVFYDVDVLPPVAEAMLNVLYRCDNEYSMRIEGDTWSKITGLLQGNIGDAAASANQYGKYYYCMSDACVYRCETETVDNSTKYVWRKIVSDIYGAFTINNITTGDETEIVRLRNTEEVVMDGDNRIISTTWENRVFGQDFNWVWPALQYGDNTLMLNGCATVKIEYRVPIKCGDM